VPETHPQNVNAICASCGRVFSCMSLKRWHERTCRGMPPTNLRGRPPGEVHGPLSQESVGVTGNTPTERTDTTRFGQLSSGRVSYGSQPYVHLPCTIRFLVLHQFCIPPLMDRMPNHSIGSHLSMKISRGWPYLVFQPAVTKSR
jgi:hypothetical protein